MDSLRNIMLAGLGAVGYSQDKIKEVIQKLIEKGELTRAQGEQVLNEWVTRGKEEQDKISAKISAEIQKAVSKLPFVSRDEFTALVRRVEALERRLPAG